MAKLYDPISTFRATLNQFKDRRTSVLSELQEVDNPPKVESAWDIACVEQLIIYAKDDSVDFWIWMQIIRRERDQFRDHLDQAMKYARDMHNKYAEAFRQELSLAQDQMTDYRKEVAKLRLQVNTLNRQPLKQSKVDPDGTKAAPYVLPPRLLDSWFLSQLSLVKYTHIKHIYIDPNRRFLYSI